MKQRSFISAAAFAAFSLILSVECMSSGISKLLSLSLYSQGFGIKYISAIILLCCSLIPAVISVIFSAKLGTAVKNDETQKTKLLPFVICLMALILIYTGIMSYTQLNSLRETIKSASNNSSLSNTNAYILKLMIHGLCVIIVKFVIYLLSGINVLVDIIRDNKLYGDPNGI